MAYRNEQALKNEAPVAPKDPVMKRGSFFVMYEKMIEATARPGGIHSQEVYLDAGRLAENAGFSGGVEDAEILEMLKTTAGIRRLVHSIGVSAKLHGNESGSFGFVFEHWGKTDKFGSGTRLRLECPGDGSETVLELDRCEWSSDDDVPGKFAFELEQPGALATANIVFYLNDGFHVPETQIETPVDFESEAYRQMIAGSLLSTGNNVRLKAAIEKAKRGEDVTLAYIGGSITQGAGAKPIHTRSYAYRSYSLFKSMFGQEGQDHIHLIKAGVGGTPSELGIVRYDRDVLRDGAVSPDIVIIEFAVNDAGDETEGECFESLVLKALSHPGRPAVVLLFSVFINDWNLQDRLKPVGDHYDLPMVSIKDAVTAQFRLTKAEGNVISKRQFFYDIYHPTNDGHAIMADCLGHLFAQSESLASGEEDIVTLKPPAIGNGFTGTRLLDRSGGAEGIAWIDPGCFTASDSELQMAEMDHQPFGTPQFPHNWMREDDAGDQPFVLNIVCRRLILVYKDSGSTVFGSAEVKVDGSYKLTADPHLNDWTHCNAVILADGQDAKEHRIEIAMAPGHEDKRFTILGFGYVE